MGTRAAPAARRGPRPREARPRRPGAGPETGGLASDGSPAHGRGSSPEASADSPRGAGRPRPSAPATSVFGRRERPVPGPTVERPAGPHPAGVARYGSTSPSPVSVHLHGDAPLPDPRRRERSAPAASQAPTERLVVPAKIRVPATDALPRERLEGRLAELWSHRLGLVVAPAGSGKTTLLARFAASAGVPVAWYRAETWDRDETALVRHLHAALGRALPGLTNGWLRVEDAAEALDAWDGGRALLVVDDLHALEGTAAEAALARFIEYAPPWLAILAGSRIVPEVNVSRLRVSGELLEIDADDLRFRSWEAERLFRDFYGETIPPGDIATLARRTEGWAAGLQLFHLTPRGKPAAEGRRRRAGRRAR